MKPIYTIDLETDPFEYGRYPEPFAVGIFDGETYKRYWGSDCREKALAYLVCQNPGIIYAHNGGRFDFFYLIKWFAGNTMRVIGSRIVAAKMMCMFGEHELRDSYAIIPVPLKSYKGKTQKKEIDIWKLEREHREKYKFEILEYLEFDCRALWELVVAFRETFGNKYTIGSAAMKQLKSFHTFENLEEGDDEEIRSKYFYGGRVECFQKGELPGAWKVYDVNSMYPDRMRNVEHPIGPPSYDSAPDILPETCFITVTGRNHGAFPMRVKGGGVVFDVPYGTFHVTRHEWDVAIKHGLFEPEKIHSCLNFEQRETFGAFVDHFYAARQKAKEIGDAVNDLFNKLVMNSGYGKFAQNPERYAEWFVTDNETDMHSGGWEIDTLKKVEGATWIVWTKPSVDTSRYNVATGASITGAARAKLLDAIAVARNPLYCDTDSLICEDLPGLDVDPKRLGAWKLEAESDLACIAGKKLYALFNGGEKVKQANKGVRIEASDIVRVCRGEIVLSERDAPSFKLDGSYNFISRRVRMT